MSQICLAKSRYWTANFIKNQYAAVYVQVHVRPCTQTCRSADITRPHMTHMLWLLLTCLPCLDPAPGPLASFLSNIRSTNVV